MADKLKTKAFKLPAESIQTLKDLGAQFEEAEGFLDTLSKIGIDPSDLRKQLQWAKNTRDVLLKEVG